MGACIQCSNRNCFTAYHVTCAREYGLYLKAGTEGENRAFCHKHLPVSFSSYQRKLLLNRVAMIENL